MRYGEGRKLQPILYGLLYLRLLVFVPSTLKSPLLEQSSELSQTLKNEWLCFLAQAIEDKYLVNGGILILDNAALYGGFDIFGAAHQHPTHTRHYNRLLTCIFARANPNQVCVQLRQDLSS